MAVNEQREEEQDEEEAGSFSPQLLHGDEDEEAIDPEVDQAELVQSSVHLVDLFC